MQMKIDCGQSRFKVRRRTYKKTYKISTNFTIYFSIFLILPHFHNFLFLFLFQVAAITGIAQSYGAKAMMIY